MYVHYHTALLSTAALDGKMRMARCQPVLRLYVDGLNWCCRDMWATAVLKRG